MKPTRLKIRSNFVLNPSRLALKASALLVIGLGVLSSLNAAPVTIANWSFEDPLYPNNSINGETTGWSGSTLILAGTASGFDLAGTIPNGNQFIGIINSNSFFQTLTFDAPGDYQLTYWEASRIGAGPSGGILDYEVSIGGNVIRTDSTVNAQQFTLVTQQFTILEAGNYDLMFEGLTVGGDHTAYFDAMQIQSIPEPTTVVLFGLGLLGTGLLYRRRAARA